MGSGFGMGYYLKLEWVSKKGFPGANVLNNLMTTREWEELTLCVAYGEGGCCRPAEG